MNIYEIPVDRESIALTTFSVESFQVSEGSKSSSLFSLVDNLVVRVEVEVSGVKKDSSNHSDVVAFTETDLEIDFSQWDLELGTRYPVTIRFYKFNELKPRLMCGLFTYTRIILIPQ